MTVPVLDYFLNDWLIVPESDGPVQLRLVASPPVAANAGATVFSRATSNKQPGPWNRLGTALIDNLPNTPQGEVFQMPIRQHTEYVLVFRGEAHVLMPGFQDVTVEFDVLGRQGLLTDYGGPKTAKGTTGAGINGNVFVRCI